jgi:DUF4097 and DUF4098 domain-containing protein YvlB
MHRVFLIAALAGGAVAQLAAAEWTKNFAVQGTPDLRVETNDARIAVTSWGRNEVAARVVTEGWEISSDQVRVTETQTGDRVSLEVKVPRFEWSWFQNHRRSVKIEISVPSKANLDVRTGDGAVSLESLEGTVHVNTGDGAIRAENLRGDIRLSSGDGRIEGRGLAGAVRLSTGDGAIDVRDVQGDVDLSTGDGRIDALELQAALRAKTNDGRVSVDGRFSRLDLRTGDGAVTAVVREGSRMEQNWNLSSNDGSITLRLPEVFPAELDASTGDGRVTLDFPVKISGSLSKSRIHGTIQEGGQRLELRTGDGAIRVSRL